MRNEVVKRYSIQDYEAVYEFMKKASGIEVINEEIMNRSILIKKEEEIIGMVSYEGFESLGVIRYFIYSPQVTPDLLVNMFFELYASAKEVGVNQLVTVVKQAYACQLFELLGFVEIKKEACLEKLHLFNDEQVKVMSIKF